MSGALRCAFLTMEDTRGWSIDAELAIEPLGALGWSVDSVPWQRTVDWRRWQAVYVGTPWDYPENPGHFLGVLAAIEAAGALLANPLELVRWNLAKTYLRDLGQQGVDIVPTEWHERLGAAEIDALARRAALEPLVVKPVVSTNATHTYPLEGPLDPALRAELARVFAERACMVQPFVQAIRGEGEYSLFHIGGTLSHAIRKRPKPGDFRVQEEHGAHIEACRPEAGLADVADAVLARVTPAPLYARSDFVRAADGRFLLMELELIEPSLYLRMDPGAPARFAQAFDDWARARLG